MKVLLASLPLLMLVRVFAISQENDEPRLSTESIVEAARTQPTLASWAGAFSQRYLDLSPVTNT